MLFFYHLKPVRHGRERQLVVEGGKVQIVFFSIAYAERRRQMQRVERRYRQRERFGCPL